MKNKVLIIFILPIFFLLNGLNTNGFCSSVRHQYFKAERKYNELKKSKTRKKYRVYWKKSIEAFEKAYKKDPKDQWAPVSMFYSGYLYFELAEISFFKKDIESGIDIMKKLIKRYPGSKYKFKALNEIRKNSPKLKSSKYKTSAISKKNKTKKSKIKKKALPGKQKKIYKARAPAHSKITNKIGMIRFHTYPNRTRIVVETKDEIKYKFNDLQKDIKNGKPQRIYVDFIKTDIGDKISSKYLISDPQVEELRIARFDKNTIRLVIDLEKNAKDFKIFSLFKPSRTVIDVWGSSNTTSNEFKNHPDISTSNNKAKHDPVSIVKQLALGVNKIVIDPGHGGRDYGAPGYYKNTHEKYVTLNFSKELAARIKKELKIKTVILTRKTDKYLTLGKRTEIANKNKADLFISIHANSARNSKASGIETYFLNLATDEDSISVAARENATSTKNISDLQTILNDLMRDAKINESSRLASYIQDSMVKSIKQKYKYVKNRGVKQAPFYVLIGAKMPAVLIELSFISNPRECKRLHSKKYLDKLCDGILEGVKKYIKEITPKANVNYGYKNYQG